MKTPTSAIASNQPTQHSSREVPAPAPLPACRKAPLSPLSAQTPAAPSAFPPHSAASLVIVLPSRSTRCTGGGHHLRACTDTMDRSHLRDGPLLAQSLFNPDPIDQPPLNHRIFASAHPTTPSSAQLKTAVAEVSTTMLARLTAASATCSTFDATSGQRARHLLTHRQPAGREASSRQLPPRSSHHQSPQRRCRHRSAADSSWTRQHGNLPRPHLCALLNRFDYLLPLRPHHCTRGEKDDHTAARIAILQLHHTHLRRSPRRQRCPSPMVSACNSLAHSTPAALVLTICTRFSV